MIVRGDHTLYLDHGPIGVDPLDESIARQTRSDPGVTLGDDGEVDWPLPPLVWEVWFERQADETLRAIGCDTHFDYNLNSDDVHTVINGIRPLARAPNAQDWATLSGPHQPFTTAYATDFINEPS